MKPCPERKIQAQMASLVKLIAYVTTKQHKFLFQRIDIVSNPLAKL